MCKQSQPIYKPFLQQSTLFSLTSLISLQTKIYQTERSLSESWGARSKTRSGFDVASVIAFQPWANYRVLTEGSKKINHQNMPTISPKDAPYLVE
jgi:hypothetical protein